MCEYKADPVLMCLFLAWYGKEADQQIQEGDGGARRVCGGEGNGPAVGEWKSRVFPQVERLPRVSIFSEATLQGL